MRVRYTIILLLSAVTLCGGCQKDGADKSGHPEKLIEDTRREEKGYDLPVEETDEDEATADCAAVMEQVQDIYIKATREGDGESDSGTEQMMVQMKAAIEENGVPVIGTEDYSEMGNYQEMEKFLIDAGQGKAGDVILYEIARDGGITRKKYTYDGNDMYLLSTKGLWDDEDQPIVPYISRARIKEWDYSKKGWFGYELCVPEPPEVTEVVDGCCMVRVKPMSEENRELSEKYVRPLGYQGNNLLCSNWDSENMEQLDYNGVFEYLYQMKHQRKFDSGDYPEGIPAEEFEQIIMEYLPVTAKQIREWAVFDEEQQSYLWAKLGCMTYAPTSFGTSLPEVVKAEETGDGILKLTVDAVCDRGVWDDGVITHELTVCSAGDGSFQYIGNKILEDGIKNIPAYQYRFKTPGDKGEFAYEN